MARDQDSREPCEKKPIYVVQLVNVCFHLQGDGTAEIFSGDPGVFTFSMHAEKNFPFRKQKSDLVSHFPRKSKLK